MAEPMELGVLNDVCDKLEKGGKDAAKKYLDEIAKSEQQTKEERQKENNNKNN